jgi:hypothetical protein
MRVPFGDQMGKMSSAASDVNRVSPPLHVEQVDVEIPLICRDTATRWPSGESEGLSCLLGSPNAPISLPD